MSTYRPWDYSPIPDVGNQVTYSLNPAERLQYGVEKLTASITALNTLRNADLEVSLPSIAIVGATDASPIVITTAKAHGLNSGAAVLIAGVGGNTAANVGWPITVLSSTTFSLNGSTGNAAYTSGGTVTPIITLPHVSYDLNGAPGTWYEPGVS